MYGKNLDFNEKMGSLNKYIHNITGYQNVPPNKWKAEVFCNFDNILLVTGYITRKRAQFL